MNNRRTFIKQIGLISIMGGVFKLASASKPCPVAPKDMDSVNEADSVEIYYDQSGNHNHLGCAATPSCREWQ